MSETTAQTFDLAVVGGGPGGYVAAIRAAQLGLTTVLIEETHLGGICLNWGCIPTKALLRSAEIYTAATREGKEFGLSFEKATFDLEKVVARSRAVSNQLSGGIGLLLKKNKVTVKNGRAALTAPGQLAVTTESKTTETLAARHIILATGARARMFKGLEADGQNVWSYREALIPKVMPKNLLCVGSGAIGLEFASFYHSFGASVTIVEALDRIMPPEDTEISSLALKQFQARGMIFHLSTKVTKLDRQKDHVTATLEGSDGKQTTQKFDKVIVATGVVPNTEKLGLEVLKVDLTAQGFIKTDPFMQTSAAGIYAIGDVAGAPCLAHKASHEGILCVEKIAGLNPKPLKKNHIPSCYYTTPQVAAVGLNERTAKEEGFDVRIGRFPLKGNGKAIAYGDSDGLVKVLFDKKTGELLGAHLIGPEVTEMIQGLGIAMSCETTEEELMETIFAHPTISEAIHESVLSAYGRALHI